MSEAKMTVVVIEDETAMIELVKLILERKGLKVVGALTGREGLETVRRIKPGLILLDLTLPDMDGGEVRRQIKADPELRHIPIQVIGARADGIDDALERYLRSLGK